MQPSPLQACWARSTPPYRSLLWLAKSSSFIRVRRVPATPTKSLFHDHGLEPTLVHEVRELQIAIGLVAAEEGVSIVPESVRRARADDVRYRELVEPATSPIIMSHRVGDRSPEIIQMSRIIARKYTDWGYSVPESMIANARSRD